MLQYDGADYDLNALFQLDVLKKLIEALAKRQLEIDKKLSMGSVNINMTGDSNVNFDELLKQNEENDGTQEDDIEKRVTRIEKKLNNLGILEKWIRNVEKKTNTTGDNILALSDKVEVVNSKVAENKESLHKLDEKINAVMNSEGISLIFFQ